MQALQRSAGVAVRIAGDLQHPGAHGERGARIKPLQGKALVPAPPQEGLPGPGVQLQLTRNLIQQTSGAL